MVIRDIIERKQTEAALQRRTTFVQLLQVIAAAANEAADINTALQFALTQICVQTKWDVGHVYFLSDATEDALIPSQLWYLRDSPQFKKFQTATHKIRFKIGEGFPGLTAAEGKPTWIRDVSQDRHFRRKKAAQAVGLQTAFAFSVAVEHTIIAVLEFFATDAQDLDEAFLDVMANIGSQLGVVFERERARAELQEKSALLQLLQGHSERQAQKTDPLIHELLHDLSTEIQRLHTLLDDLRAFARPQQLHLQPTDLASLVTEVLAIEGDAYATQGIQVRHSLPAALPLVQADGERLKQVVLNLCQNAVEAMQPGGRLTVTAGHSGKQVWLEVTDTGEGIPEGLDIFDLFMTTKAEGTGLGLAIVRPIVQSHGGTMAHTSQVGKGTTFRVCLPRSRE